MGLASDAIELEEISDPGAPAADKVRLFSQDENGFTTLVVRESSGNARNIERDQTIVVRNVSGTTIAKGVCVYFTGASSGIPTVDVATGGPYGLTSGDLAQGITTEAIANNSNGRVCLRGIVSGLNTSGFAAGALLFLSTNGTGALMDTEPAYPYRVQRVGRVLVSNVSTGSVFFDPQTDLSTWSSDRISIFGNPNSDPNTDGPTILVMRCANGDLDLRASHTANRQLALPDATGSLALLENITGIRNNVRVATTANITLSGTQTIDAVAVVAGDRVLVKDQTTGSQNGIWVVAAGSWQRATDADDSGLDLVSGTLIWVRQGTANGGKFFYVTTNDPITIGSTSIAFATFTGGGGGSPGGSNTQVQYNASGSFGGASKLTIDAGGYPTLGEATSTLPSVPSAGSTIFSKFRSGRRMAAQIGPSGVDYSFQPFLGANKIGLWMPNGNGTTVGLLGLGNSTTGTATARNVATTSLATSLRRVAYVSATTAGSSAGTRHGAAQFYRGNAAGRAGFLYVARFVIDTVQSGMRWFVGLLNATAVIGNVNPSTLTNMVGFGIDASQTTVRFFNNDGSGTATATDLGANFPATTADVVYEIRIFSAPNGSDIFYSIERLDVAQLAEGSVSTDIPTNTTLLSPQMWINNGATAAAVAISVISQYTETDN